MAKLRNDGGWYKNAAGLYVQGEPIDKSLVAAAATNAIPRVKSDDTLEFATLTAGTDITITHGAGTVTIASTASGGGGGGSGEGIENAVAATPTDVSYNSSLSDHFTAASLDVKWTGVNTGSLTTTMDKSGVILSTSTATIFQGYKQALPNAPWTLVAKCGGYLSADFQARGLFLYEASSGRFIDLAHEHASTRGVYAQEFTNVPAFSSTIGNTADVDKVLGSFIYLKITNDSTNHDFYWSTTGVDGTWVSVGQQAINNWFTTDADDFGFFTSASASGSGGALVRSVFDFVFVYDAVV